jgi:hypothetical protein
MYKIEEINVILLVNGRKVQYNVDLEMTVDKYEYLRDDLNDLFMEVTSELDNQIYYEVPRLGVDLGSDDDYE